MRILHTAATFAPSLDGVAEVVRNISERLAGRGHEVHVATAAADSESTHSRHHGVHVHRFSVTGNLALGLRGETEKYRHFVRSGNWDLVVNHCLRVWPTDAILPEIDLLPWPSVLATHGVPAYESVYGPYYLEVAGHLSAYSRWVCVSKSSGEKCLAEKLGLPEPRVITNGVDMEEWSRPPVGLRELWKIGDAPWIVNVSNHAGNLVKNHAALFELAGRLRRQGVRVTQIGNSHKAAKWNLGSLGIRGGCFYSCRARAMLSGSLELQAKVPREQVVAAIQEADVLVSTSRREANSLVLLESMAAAVPWISFDVGSARENAGGVVVHNLDEMRQAVAKLLDDPELRRNLGNAGRAQVVEKHDWNSIVDEYEQLYESVLNRSFTATSVS